MTPEEGGYGSARVAGEAAVQGGVHDSAAGATGGVGGLAGGVRYSPGHLARLLGLPEPTAEQAAVISAPLQPVAVVAGAGSGKSETMAGRLVWLVANGLVRPDRVLGLTFTRKAAGELGQRVRARLAGLRRAGLAREAHGPAAAAGTLGALGAAGAGVLDGTWGGALAGGGGALGVRDGNGGGALCVPGAADGAALEGEPAVSTYHSYAARLVGDHALREALEPSLRLITPAVAWQIAARMVAAHAGPMDAVTWSPPEVTAAVIALAGELAEHLRDPDDVAGFGNWLRTAAMTMPGTVTARHRKILDVQRAREQLLPIVAAYTAAKSAREVMDYGDQVALAARIATRHPEVGAAERARYQVVLLDEFQDTSHAQLVLLRALFGGGHPVTAVGDPCQSIYGWRGASAGNLRRFAQQFPVHVPAWQPGPAGAVRPATVRLLATSFRNTERVLDVAAAIQRGLPEQTPEVPRLVPAPARAGRGTVICALLETAADEARWVAERVTALLELPPGTAPDGRPWPAPGPARGQEPSIAVLCRKRAQFPALRAALEARGISVEVVGLGGLLTVPEVADIVATLRVLHDAGASGPLVRLLTGPRWRIGPRDLVALGRRARELADRRPETGPPGSGRPREGGGPEPAEGNRAQPATPEAAGDPMTGAVTDLTADPGSLVEALDDLGDPSAYSPAGYARYSALAAELRALRAHAGQPLPDLVGEVERALGLDVEVAAQPRRDPGAARADLDAFADAAAAFASDDEEPTLGAFLAYLTAAENEEFGLESGQPAGTSSVTLTTVHAAKGLEWDAVVVPGMAAGPRSQVFPARPKVTTRWTENARLLPFSLRGDAEDLPALPDLRPESLGAFASACTARELAEERRLAYVAVTRAAFWVACTGYWWGEGATPLGPSVFLDEVRAVCEAGGGTVAHWAVAPAEDAQNPALAEPAALRWPVSPSGPGHTGVREAAALVQAALASRDRGREGSRGREPARETAPGAGPVGRGSAAIPGPEVGPGAAASPGAAAGPDAAGPDAVRLTGPDRALARAWARDADLLLDELAQRRGGAATAVRLPGRLSVSSLVTMAADPRQLAQQIRRPMPRPPAPQARRGTAFHRWLEERFGQQRLIDPADLLGAADDPADDPDAADLADLRARFEAGEWGNRWPIEVEVPFETHLAGRAIGGRIDAVFGDPAGRYDVVDWKTGQPPATPAETRAAAVQLAAYRVAWSRLAGVPLEQVRAAFYFVRHDLTLRPADLLDAAGLAALIEGIPEGG
jgi:DNA helicase-2/ATP-dependent DNA helicase PcrA